MDKLYNALILLSAMEAIESQDVELPIRATDGSIIYVEGVMLGFADKTSLFPA